MRAEIVRHNAVTGAPVTPYLSVNMENRGVTQEDLLIIKALRYQLLMIAKEAQDKLSQKEPPAKSST